MAESRKQIRITGAKRSGVRVFYALDVPADLVPDTRSSRYVAWLKKSLRGFHSKHPTARLIETRFVKFKRSDHAW